MEELEKQNRQGETMEKKEENKQIILAVESYPWKCS